MEEMIKKLADLNINVDSASAVEIADKIMNYEYVTFFTLVGIGILIMLIVGGVGAMWVKLWWDEEKERIEREKKEKEERRTNEPPLSRSRY